MGQIKFFSVKLGMNTIKPILCVLEKAENIPTFGRDGGVSPLSFVHIPTRSKGGRGRETWDNNPNLTVFIF